MGQSAEFLAYEVCAKYGVPDERRFDVEREIQLMIDARRRRRRDGLDDAAAALGRGKGGEGRGEGRKEGQSQGKSEEEEEDEEDKPAADDAVFWEYFNQIGKGESNFGGELFFVGPCEGSAESLGSLVRSLFVREINKAISVVFVFVFVFV